MKKSDWEIPTNLQPDPDDYPYDLERTLKGVVSVKSYVPGDAFTANTLGTERAGSGVVIRDNGLVATIGYLITEADTIWLTAADGRAIPATPSPTTRRADLDWCRHWAGWTSRWSRSAIRRA